MRVIILTTDTCIKCKDLKPKLKELCSSYNISLEEVKPADALGTVLINTYNVMQVPAVFIYDNSDEMCKSFVGDIYLQSVERVLKFLLEQAGN